MYHLDLEKALRKAIKNDSGAKNHKKFISFDESDRDIIDPEYSFDDIIIGFRKDRPGETFIVFFATGEKRKPLKGFSSDKIPLAYASKCDLFFYYKNNKTLKKISVDVAKKTIKKFTSKHTPYVFS